MSNIHLVDSIFVDDDITDAEFGWYILLYGYGKENITSITVKEDKDGGEQINREWEYVRDFVQKFVRERKTGGWSKQTMLEHMLGRSTI